MSRLRGLAAAASAREAKELLSSFSLTEHAGKFAQHLSGGLKRKLSLAISVTGSPSFLALDEPTSGMDILVRQQFW